MTRCKDIFLRVFLYPGRCPTTSARTSSWEINTRRRINHRHPRACCLRPRTTPSTTYIQPLIRCSGAVASLPCQVGVTTSASSVSFDTNVKATIFFSPEGGCSEGLDTFRFFLNHYLLISILYLSTGRPGSSEVPRNPLTRWDVSSIPANRIFLKKNYNTKIKMLNGWRTIKSLVHKIRLHGRRGNGMAECFSREKLRHAPQKERG